MSVSVKHHTDEAEIPCQVSGQAFCQVSCYRTLAVLGLFLGLPIAKLHFTDKAFTVGGLTNRPM